MSEDIVGNVVNALDRIANVGRKEHYRKAVEGICYRTHRTLQQGIMRLFLETIREWAEAYDTGQYDARNEATVKLSRKIVDAIEGDDYLPFI